MSDQPQVHPLVWTTLHPVNTDTERVRRALAKLAEGDPTFKVENEDLDGQIIITAMDEKHLEIICDRLAYEHRVHVEPRRDQCLVRRGHSRHFRRRRQIRQPIGFPQPLRPCGASH